jgi:hypothetical protein
MSEHIGQSGCSSPQLAEFVPELVEAFELFLAGGVLHPVKPTTSTVASAKCGTRRLGIPSPSIEVEKKSIHAMISHPRRWANDSAGGRM